MRTPNPENPGDLQLGIEGFAWADLHDPIKLEELHRRFMDGLERDAAEVAARLRSYHACRGEGMTPEAVSNVLIDAAPHVGAFVATLFGVEAERAVLVAEAEATKALFRMKDQLVKRRALKRGAIAQSPALTAEAEQVLGALDVTGAQLDDEAKVAEAACALLDLEAELKKKEPQPGAAAPLRARLAEAGFVRTDKGAEPASDFALVTRCLEVVEKWLMARQGDPADAAARTWQSFKLPHKLDPEHLVHVRRPNDKLPELMIGPTEHLRPRDGFSLTDRRMSRLEVQNEVDYCLYCHDRDKDSCSKGLRDNKTKTIKANSLGVKLDGCPLYEKISEMHIAKRGGDSLAALALITVDNPMCPGTGHRICNDCMKACVFQTQEPVNIPQIETGALTDVLRMPWGFEIYGLLTRWNPLRAARPHALPYHGKKVMVVGLGPAGYTLVHYLLNEGFGVVGIDGLKIEPLPEELLDRPIRDFDALTAELDEKVGYGFGGVSEYGITVRWDKNFLTVIYLTLARRKHVRFYGGVRFGGTVTLDDAWQMGFDHVAIAAGAGKPTIIDLENNLIRGIRKASDFLMALQLTGAFKKSTMANLQVRLPAVVIGGGLTGIDTATELRAYYIVQVEKIAERYHALVKLRGVQAVRGAYDREELGILDEFLAHAEAVAAERAAAAASGRAPDFNTMIDAWGGVTLAYRKRMQDSPAYRLNHEEIIKGLEEGIRFAENLSPKAAIPDEYGALKALTFVRQDGSLVELPARSLCVAAGTAPNTIYEREHPGTFTLDKRGFFLAHRAVVGDGGVQVEPGDGFFTSYRDARGHTVSYYGDNHPRYAGSVVKAMASAKDGHPYVAALFEKDIIHALANPAGQALREAHWDKLVADLDDSLGAQVVAVNRLTNTIVEVIVRAPNQARKFNPGQFYRLQNFENRATMIEGTRLAMEGLALTGAWVDVDKGLLSLIVLEMGGSSRLVAALKIGERVVLMGPTGAPTETPPGETVLLAGGGLGNAVLFSIAKALRAVGNKVVYFAGYKQPSDVFKQDDIEAATDQVIWSADVGPAIKPRRPHDRAFVGNIVQAMVAYAQGELGERLVDLKQVDRVIAIGSDRMMAAVAGARRGVLAPYLKPTHVGIGSINSPMQCMMKEVCAQCLQKHVDPRTGKTDIVFSCFNQDQHLDSVDWKNLNDRLRQNTVQEKLSAMWLAHLLERQGAVARV
jgi:NADPH-dependent glutamate synthase beta subunit-like oxidoreductase/NAD(P)H-flavin reductase